MNYGMTRARVWLGLFFSGLLAVATLVFGSVYLLGRAGERSSEYLTPLVKVDGIYPSMLGPQSTDTNVRLDLSSEPELLWVTGYQAEMVGPQGELMSQELMCHDTLSLHDTLKTHAAIMGSGFMRTRRLFTLSQGQSSLQFPKGFGIPVSSAQRFMLQSQVLNLRHDRIGSDVSHRVKTTFVSEKDTDGAMRPLTLIDLGIALEVEDKQARDMPDNPLSCAGDAGGQPTFRHGGKEMTAHWVVKPGPEKRVTALPRAFPFDTRIHYIGVHLHGYAQSLELWDKTENRSVFKALTRWTDDGQGLAEVGHLSSEAGIPVFANHQYELISHYNNTSDQEQTAMAFMFCYVADPYFKKPEASGLARRSEEFCGTSSGLSVEPPPSDGKTLR